MSFRHLVVCYLAAFQDVFSCNNRYPQLVNRNVKNTHLDLALTSDYTRTMCEQQAQGQCVTSASFVGLSHLRAQQREALL